jgi:hypothetical protein
MIKDLIKNEISIELHYNFVAKDVHVINFHTRNTCALAQVELISYIIKTLYPHENFEILSLPPRDGSFKDLTVVKFLNKNQGVVQGVVSVVGIIFAGLLFNGQAQLNKSTVDLNTLEILEKCKNLSVDDESIKKIGDICNSYYPKKQKNYFYESVIADGSVISIKPTVSNDEQIFEKEINKNDFENYIEDIPKEKEFLRVDLSGHIQLSQPFIDKQQQYGRGVAWKGIYYGDDVFDETGELIIQDGEYVFFYMQDDEYKMQILNQEISFTSGDNIGVVFDVSRYYDYLNDKFGKPRLYVKRVVSHNDNLVQHKKDLALKREKDKLEAKNKNQRSLFDPKQN